MGSLKDPVGYTRCVSTGCYYFLKIRAPLFIVRCGLRAMGARRGWIQKNIRLKIAMRWVPVERGKNAEK